MLSMGTSSVKHFFSTFLIYIYLFSENILSSGKTKPCLPKFQAGTTRIMKYFFNSYSSAKANIEKVPEQYPRDSHEDSLHEDPLYPI